MFFCMTRMFSDLYCSVCVLLNFDLALVCLSFNLIAFAMIYVPLVYRFQFKLYFVLLTFPCKERSTTCLLVCYFISPKAQLRIAIVKLLIVIDKQ